MKVTMSTEKETSSPTAEPTFVIAAAQTEPGVAARGIKSGRLTRKHVLIAAVALAIAVIVLVAVLVGIRLVADSNMAILKYTMSMKDSSNKDVEQNVSVDANVVMYHVVKDGQDVWVINDFDKNIQVAKITADSSVLCYVTPLNRSEAADPNSIPSSAPKTDEKTPSKQVLYQVSDTPISDISFLGKRVTNLCQNIPTYWLQPYCNNATGNMSGPDSGRSKRGSMCATCYGYYSGYGSRYWNCQCGCCGVVCGLFTSNTYYYYYSNGYYVCVYYMSYVCANIGLRPTCRYNGGYYYYP